MARNKYAIDDDVSDSESLAPTIKREVFSDDEEDYIPLRKKRPRHKYRSPSPPPLPPSEERLMALAVARRSARTMDKNAYDFSRSQHRRCVEYSAPARTTSKARKPSAKAREASNAQRRWKRKLRQPTKNLMMKLPAEIRNEIYRYVLIEQTTSTKVRPSWRFAPPHKVVVVDFGMKWKEPSLLQVSKQIRQEASAMYYATHDFLLVIEVPQLERFRTWLQSIAERCFASNTAITLGSSVIKIINCRIEEVASLLPLAFISHEFKALTRNGVECNTGWYMYSAVNDVVLLGHGREPDERYLERLEFDFEEWLKALLVSKRWKRRVRGERRYRHRGAGKYWVQLRGYDLPSEMHGYDRYLHAIQQQPGDHFGTGEDFNPETDDVYKNRYMSLARHQQTDCKTRSMTQAP
ncbi:hypothetical protein CLAFUW4_11488 [Fulvia fulva]|uniref:Uncharacterized protein n=1 Tax=Passalora fulva TaxID=5499 RepID=A0A9Q8URF7_PASFU|nr:uncharacterized protein CLAFUR5_10532 [Fulvia fulva]KAK4620017.1 hypothetical protein CLAFUR4_11494 [Fulvia fulva]KAK4620547.1 hypothetical protein CLAFUR0_11502 [Fulvia fulva]UJO19703.1 hypothetical protein CLAFUR5_10532 [Fulvia fulva]WPV17068.1 hypothetical protein CLAFUW4_11488 [Fulvia fulva]WPV31860.1 hypothetical protein CLAFUW7_11493 [Fulvia fulva]